MTDISEIKSLITGISEMIKRMDSKVRSLNCDANLFKVHNIEEEEDFYEWLSDYNEISDYLEDVYLLLVKKDHIETEEAMLFIEKLYRMHIDFSKKWALDD